MYGHLQRFSLLLVSILSVVLMIFQNPLAFAAKEKEPLSEACEALLKTIPHADLLYDWNRKNIPQVQQWLKQINLAFSKSTPFTDEQLQGLLNRITHQFDDEMQLRHLLDPKFTGEHSVQIKPGQMGEWEQPIYDWLNSILQKPEQTREQIIERQKQYQKRGPLNPIQKYRYQKIVNEVAEFETQIGQKVTTDNELQYAALEGYLHNRLIESLQMYRNAKIPASVSILDLKHKLQLIDARSHSSTRFGDISGLTAKVAGLNEPEVFAEIDYYFSLAQDESSYYEHGDIIRARFLSWYFGQNHSFQDSLHAFILKEVREMFEVHSSGGLGPHYVGEASSYSIGDSVGIQAAELGLKAMKENLESIDWDQAKVSLLGTWQTTTIPRLFGLPIDGENEREYKHYLYMFAVEFKDTMQHRHFVVQVEPKMIEGSESLPLGVATYKNLIGLDIKEIRETLLPPRAQDGFQTQPIDLAEPLVELKSAEGTAFFRIIPTQIIFKRLPLTKEQALKPRSDLTISHLVADAIQGGPSQGEYAKLQFFHNGRQLSPDDLFLYLAEETPSQQTFINKVKVGPLTYLYYYLERNLLNNTYTLSVSQHVGIGSFKIKTKHWIGTYQPPRH